MNPVSLKVVSAEGTEATLTCTGSHAGQEDYYSTICVKGFIENKKVYGIDPVQSFTLGWALIEELTREKRIGNDNSAVVVGASWRIESL